jgi:AbrB family looped-hinge helix DNA binding protein
MYDLMCISITIYEKVSRQMHTSTVTSKGQITIPADLRKSLGLRPGQQVTFSRTENALLITPMEDDVTATFGLLKAEHGVSLQEMDEAVAEMAKDLNDRA